MLNSEILNILEKKLNFSRDSINKLNVYVNMVLNANKSHNFISKKTEADVWSRHILDSAQIVKYFDKSDKIFADLGAGAGFPGIVISIYGIRFKFHVKLYEKSPVKREFLSEVKKKLNLNLSIKEDVYKENIIADVVCCRAFKKIDKVINISREIVKKPHKLIVLKGKNASAEIKKVSIPDNFSYKLFDSITKKDSKIVIFKKKNE